MHHCVELIIIKAFFITVLPSVVKSCQSIENIIKAFWDIIECCLRLENLSRNIENALRIIRQALKCIDSVFKIHSNAIPRNFL